MQLVEQAFAHPSGGFREAGVRPFQANPQMHLLEAALAWAEAGGGGRWDDLAARIAKLALERFIDEEGGFLREYFDAEWRPANGELGRIVEPGHQFEWAWLLHRWGKRAGDGRSIEAARRLVLAGERGVDRSRGVVVAELHDDLTIRKDVARLWPQAERLKAALVCGGDPSVDGLAAAHGLSGYLATRVGGLWRDKQLATGLYVDEAIPASSLYHLVGALEALVDVAP
jgi:mannose/cellobiose epimerase-like protein (N-acyl-D-glucosamine 2-epimerase family)